MPLQFHDQSAPPPLTPGRALSRMAIDTRGLGALGPARRRGRCCRRSACGPANGFRGVKPCANTSSRTAPPAPWPGGFPMRAQRRLRCWLKTVSLTQHWLDGDCTISGNSLWITGVGHEVSPDSGRVSADVKCTFLLATPKRFEFIGRRMAGKLADTQAAHIRVQYTATMTIRTHENLPVLGHTGKTCRITAKRKKTFHPQGVFGSCRSTGNRQASFCEPTHQGNGGGTRLLHGRMAGFFPGLLYNQDSATH